jgi:homocysteine S-methyltransferase
MAYDSRVLPQLDGSVFLMDGGLETTLIFLEGVDLPCFAAFPLLLDTAGCQKLRGYFEPFIKTAMKYKAGFILDTPTWRSNADWGAKLGYSGEQLADVNRQAVALAKDIKSHFATSTTPIVVNGAIGPRGDGYRVDKKMTAEEACAYHTPQIETFREAGAEMVSAHHDELYRGGHRHRQGGSGERHSGSCRFYRRDRWQTCIGRYARSRDRNG